MENHSPASLPESSSAEGVNERLEQVVTSNGMEVVVSGSLLVIRSPHFQQDAKVAVLTHPQAHAIIRALAAVHGESAATRSAHDDPRHIYHPIFNPSGCDKFYCLRRFDPNYVAPEGELISREAVRDKIEELSSEWERLGDYGVNQGYVRMIKAANEIADAIRSLPAAPAVPIAEVGEGWQVTSWGYEDANVSDGTTEVKVISSACGRPLDQGHLPRTLAVVIANTLNGARATPSPVDAEEKK